MKKETLTSKDLISMYDAKVSIDTIHLTAKLDDKQREYLYDRFSFNKNNSKKWHWHYSQNETRALGFSVQALPNNSFTYKHYDHMLQLQKQITTTDDIPYSLAEIIENIDWNIKRIDIAFDFKIPTEKTLIMKHHGNVQFEPSNEKWTTEYLGKLATRSPSKVAYYNRNDKEIERQTGLEHEYNNRIEVRIYPASNDELMKLHNMNDELILKHLSKYRIIPNIDDLPTSKPNKKKLYLIKENYDYLRTLGAKKQKELKAVTTTNRIPLEQIYLEHKQNLFQFTKTLGDGFIYEPNEDSTITTIDRFIPIEIPNEDMIQQFR